MMKALMREWGCRYRQYSPWKLRERQYRIMDRVLIPLMVISCGAYVWSNKASVEILRTPSKVVVMKPNPISEVSFQNISFPDLNENVTDILVDGPDLNDSFPQIILDGPGLNESVTQIFVGGPDDSSNTMTIATQEADGSWNNITSYMNETNLPEAENRTCVRVDFEDHAAAVFIDQVGPIEAAHIIFNSSFEGLSQLLNATDVTELKPLNETYVDCAAYSSLLEPFLSSLSPGALASLADCKKYTPSVTRRLSHRGMSSLVG